ncbi:MULTISPECIES: DNA-binding protein [Cryobacterium]|uniref:DNA-binding protein n=1 Tax=Cryobacterium gelidum TaxID=1259164 RepID=A0A4R9AU93_9MICO|nr:MULTISPECIES: DNA-binding protein [Cryobacterium]TFB68295.1 DNA-binding protein [Cryobacterium sp. Hz9]TFD69858.1 DNA-binding protein [Cryobacterium gelidum]
MFVITADQIDSRNDHDRAREMIARLVAPSPNGFSLPPDQTAGDEIQLLVSEAEPTLDAILALHRSGHWSVGLGVGTVRTPLPPSTRQATGGAFIAARDAVLRAKRTEAHFALEVGHTNDASPGIEALLTMLLLLRQRRTPQGWQAGDLFESGLAQTEIAASLGITTGAVSQRLKAAQYRVEQAARPALVRLLEQLDHGPDRGPNETDTTA